MEAAADYRPLRYIAYDPQEDTETSSRANAFNPRLIGYIAYDPQEDTETGDAARRGAYRGCVTSPTIRKRILKQQQMAAYTQAVQQVTSPTIRKRILKRHRGSNRPPPSRWLHRLRSARGY